MKFKLFFIGIFLSILSCDAQYNNGFIKYAPAKLTSDQKAAFAKTIEGKSKSYDASEKMLTVKVSTTDYNTLLHGNLTGQLHDVRSSFWYAEDLLTQDEPESTSEAFAIIEKLISLQDTITGSKTFGLWGNYLEVSVNKMEKPDYNWADFCGVSLLNIWMGYQEKIPEPLKPQIKKAIINAAACIKKRNIGPDYTNIAVMGTYVTYMTGYLFDDKVLQTYATKRLLRFYDFTLKLKGFPEYNSSNYTLVVLDDLCRFKMHIEEPTAKKMLDELYLMVWEMIARHFHQPTAQWTGPQSRAYFSLINEAWGTSYYGLLYKASKGKIVLSSDAKEKADKIILNHQLPDKLYNYYLAPSYPRTEVDVFIPDTLQVIGTCYMAEKYNLATANRSCLWNQRRPFTAYWGSSKSPRFLQLQFLRNNYDFSSAALYTAQKENTVLGGVNLFLYGGNTHLGGDAIKSGKIKAKDFRIRLLFGRTSKKELMTLPEKENDSFSIHLDGLQFNIQFFKASFDGAVGHWEKGGNGKDAWVDYVIYSGGEKEFDLTQIKEAIWAFTFSMGSASDTFLKAKPAFDIQNNQLKATWNSLDLSVPTNLLPLGGYPKNL